MLKACSISKFGSWWCHSPSRMLDSILLDVLVFPSWSLRPASWKKSRFWHKRVFPPKKWAFCRRVGIKLFRYLSANSTLPSLAYFEALFQTFTNFGQKIISILLLTLRHFTLQEWLASNFSLQYRPWIKHEGHENKGNDHQLKKLLIVRQNLLVRT